MQLFLHRLHTEIAANKSEYIERKKHRPKKIILYALHIFSLSLLHKTLFSLFMFNVQCSPNQTKWNKKEIFIVMVNKTAIFTLWCIRACSYIYVKPDPTNKTKPNSLINWRTQFTGNRCRMRCGDGNKCMERAVQHTKYVRSHIIWYVFM